MSPASLTPGVKGSQTPGVFPAGPIIITGGNGFVGRHLLEALHQAAPDAQLSVWDKTIEGLPEYVEGHVVDIVRSETYLPHLQVTQPEWVVHLAALAAVGESFAQPDIFRQVNAGATMQLLAVLKEESPQTRVLAVSTADVYGQGSPNPLPELPLAQATPKSPYAASKWEMEKIIEDTYSDRVIRVRPFPHIGPGQRTGFVTADFASQIALIELNKQPPVLKVGNLTAVRDFTDVRDVVQAYRLLLEKGQVGEIYHVASGQGVAIQAILNELIALASVPITIETDPTRLRPADIPVLIGDASKLQQATGWQPTIPLRTSLTDILEYWRHQI